MKQFLNSKSIQTTALGLVCSCALSVAHADSGDFHVYGTAGLPGVSVGAGYSINDNFGVRGDFMTAGSISRDYNQRDFKYSGKFKNNKFNALFDYYPTGNNFRVTAGLSFGRTEIEAEGVAKQQGTVKLRLGGKSYSVTVDSKDKLYAKAKYKAVSPYLGVGFGHNTKKKGFGFVADVGVFVGKPTTTVTLNSTLNDKLVTAAANNNVSAEAIKSAQNEINTRVAQEKAKVEDKIGKYKAIPMVSIGVTYTF